MNIIAIIGKLDRLPAGAAAPLTFGRTLGTPRREQLKLLEPAQKFWCEESHRSKNYLKKTSKLLRGARTPQGLSPACIMALHLKSRLGHLHRGVPGHLRCKAMMQ